jgi:hypothetical protein
MLPNIVLKEQVKMMRKMMRNNIEDGEKRVCHACGNTEFHRNYYNLAVCSNIVCYKTYEPLRALDKLFRQSIV